MDNKPVIQFEGVAAEMSRPYDAGISDLSCVVREGDLLAVWTEHGHGHIPLADLAEGLLEPGAGRVLVCGGDWKDLPPGQVASLRGRIGRVFYEHGWVSNLDIDENIMLSERHHTTRPVEEIRAEADALSRYFGMDGIPPGRPVAMRRAELRLVEWVRALLGDRMLLILEHPMRDVQPALLPLLIAKVRAAKARGAAVIWITSDPHVWADLSAESACKLKQDGSALVRTE